MERIRNGRVVDQAEPIELFVHDREVFDVRSVLMLDARLLGSERPIEQKEELQGASEEGQLKLKLDGSKSGSIRRRRRGRGHI
jgi:hypothetical protein